MHPLHRCDPVDTSKPSWHSVPKNFRALASTTLPGALRGLGSRCAVIVAAPMERVMGTTKTAPLTNAERTGRPRHRSSAVLRFDFLRAITIATVPTRPMRATTRP